MAENHETCVHRFVAECKLPRDKWSLGWKFKYRRRKRFFPIRSRVTSWYDNKPVQIRY